MNGSRLSSAATKKKGSPSTAISPGMTQIADALEPRMGRTRLLWQRYNASYGQDLWASISHNVALYAIPVTAMFSVRHLLSSVAQGKYALLLTATKIVRARRNDTH
jgi:hypothetical protein